MQSNLNLGSILSQLDLEYENFALNVNQSKEKIVKSMVYDSGVIDSGVIDSLNKSVEEALSGAVVHWDEYVKKLMILGRAGNINSIFMRELIENLRQCNYIKRKEHIAKYYFVSDDILQIKRDEEMAKYDGLYADVESKYSRELSSKIPATKTTFRPNRDWMPWTFGHDRIPYDLDYMAMLNCSNNSQHLIRFPESPDSLNPNSDKYRQIQFLKDGMNKFKDHKSRVESMNLDEYRVYKMSQATFNAGELEQIKTELNSMEKELVSETEMSDEKRIV